MQTLRSEKTQASYDAYRANQVPGVCALCEKETIVEDFSLWKIVENIFPYDAIASLHHMIASKRHVKEADLIKEEIEELAKIKREYIMKRYDNIIESTHRTISIPSHFHLHLILVKDRIG